MDIGLLSAFIGGVLALLSPCAALLLPAFFGSTVGVGSRLVLHAAIFYVGMLLVLIPLGMGAGTLGALFTAYRGTIVLVASVILIILGIVQLFGFGFDPAKALPGTDAMRSKSATATGTTKTFLLGATSGIAGVCSGPILGAVLTPGCHQRQRFPRRRDARGLRRRHGCSAVHHRGSVVEDGTASPVCHARRLGQLLRPPAARGLDDHRGADDPHRHRVLDDERTGLGTVADLDIDSRPCSGMGE